MRLTFNSTLAEPSADSSKKGIIPNIQIARIGEARGHKVVKTKNGFESYNLQKHPPESALQVAISHASLESLIKCAGERVKCLMNHSDDINEVAGVFKNFRIDGDAVRADLHLLKSSKHHDYLLELSEECPDGFGVSINFYSTYGEVEPSNTNKTVPSICEKLVSCDLVTEPAATDGLFTVGEHTTQPTTNMAEDNSTQPPASEDIATIAANAAKEAVTEAVAPITEAMTAITERMTKLEEPPAAPAEEKTEEEKKLESEEAQKAEEEKMSTLAAAVAGAVITKLGVKTSVTPSVQNADDTTKLTFQEHVDHLVSSEGKSSLEATKVVMSKFPDKHKAHLSSLTKA